MSLSIDKPKLFVRILSNYYRDEWLGWTPSVMEATLKRNFDYDPSELELDKIEAYRELLRSDQALSEPLLFEKCVRLLNDEPATFRVWESTAPYQIAYALSQMKKVMGEDRVSESVGRRVRSYIAAAMVADDLHVGPKSVHLDVAEPELRTLSAASKSVKERVSRQFENRVMTAEPAKIEREAQAAVREEDRRRAEKEDELSREGVGENQGPDAEELAREAIENETDFAKRQIAYLTGVALYLRQRGAL